MRAELPADQRWTHAHRLPLNMCWFLHLQLRPCGGERRSKPLLSDVTLRKKVLVAVCWGAGPVRRRGAVMLRRRNRGRATGFSVLMGSRGQSTSVWRGRNTGSYGCYLWKEAALKKTVFISNVKVGHQSDPEVGSNEVEFPGIST